MPETPDFDKIARDAYTPYSGDSLEDDFKAGVAEIAEQLRLVWNARGAADAKSLEALISQDDDIDAFGLAIKTLDR